MWTLDPIDGTKGFLRCEQFAVCLVSLVDVNENIVQWLEVMPMFTDPRCLRREFMDHSSGAFLVQEAGGIASDIYSKPLDFI
ncbi:9844_t:CDS:2 [Funneliformis caledonium]|uniref:9844_t:CDS:1 n=1 Tax=Funneliformis caledonium TaxID=1117310 RepID=A0A9N8YQS7_9GLOM|nr:9844_t:CDS:2 [Funneliformis caledonium]